MFLSIITVLQVLDDSFSLAFLFDCSQIPNSCTNDEIVINTWAFSKATEAGKQINTLAHRV